MAANRQMRVFLLEWLASGDHTAQTRGWTVQREAPPQRMRRWAREGQPTKP